jgi:hypothetical protein
LVVVQVRLKEEKMGSADELGQSIKGAVDFLQQVYRQVQGLFMEAEQLLQPLGYANVTLNEVILVNSRNLTTVDEWLRPSVARIVGRKDGDAAGREFIALVVHLSPKSVMDQAVVMLERLVFETKVSGSSVQAQFNKSEWLESFVKGPAEPGATIDLRPMDLGGIFARAQIVQVAVWPLTAMKDRAAIAASLAQKVREWAVTPAAPEVASAPLV